MATTKKMIHRCGTMDAHARFLATDPNYAKRFSDCENAASRVTTTGPKKAIIPVVIHIVHSDPDSITDPQVASQIDSLNKDYSATNADLHSAPAVFAAKAASANIQFVLATKDPSGKPHSGINRRKSSSSFSSDDGIKRASSGGIDAWPMDKYLNLWVGKLGGGLLGYAQFPGGAAETDGVVINSTAFGSIGTAQAPFNLGRSATHEIGHWLGLRHIWGDVSTCGGTDFVDDTPNAQGPNFGVPTFPHVTCNNGPDGDMFPNWMDYTDDRGMVMFTQGQCDRMWSFLTSARSTFIVP